MQQGLELYNRTCFKSQTFSVPKNSQLILHVISVFLEKRENPPFYNCGFDLMIATIAERLFQRSRAAIVAIVAIIWKPTFI